MKRIFPSILATLGIVLSFGALGQLYLNNRVSSTVLELPYEVVGLCLTESKSGDQALSEFTDSHGTSFHVTSGVVGTYGNREITLWIAGTASDSVAAEWTEAMQRRIAEGASPFTSLDEINDRNRKVYILAGMGQRHYYFQGKNQVIWLAAEPALGHEALQQILEVYS
jgi:hypothetical protein